MNSSWAWGLTSELQKKMGFKRVGEGVLRVNVKKPLIAVIRPAGGRY